MDYTVARNWIFMPQDLTKKVDVFYVYPTICSFKRNASNHNMNTNNPILRLFARFVSTQHSGVFDDQCNVFAPYYRQVGLEGLRMPVKEYAGHAKKAYLDVRQAFYHYLHHFNNGRPFILAGHSQGSIMLLELMKREFHRPHLMSQMIAAYLIGFSVTPADLNNYPQLKIAQSERDTGVIITYNTGAENIQRLPIVLPDTYCVNPLNWKTNSEYASKDKNIGSVFLQIKKKPIIERTSYTGAYCDPKNNMLIIDEPISLRLMRLAHIAGAKLAIHTFDYAIFFRNLQKNVRTRIQAFFEKKAT